MTNKIITDYLKLIPKIKRPLQLIAFIFGLLTLLVFYRGDTYYSLIGLISIVFVLICIFLLKNLINHIPKTSEIPKQEKAKYSTFIFKKVYSIILLTILSIMLMITMLIMSFVYNKIEISREGRLFKKELAIVLTERLIVTEKLLYNNGINLNKNSIEYKRYREVVDDYNIKINDYINKVKKYYINEDPLIHEKFRRIRYLFVRINCCVSRLTTNDLSLDCGFEGDTVKNFLDLKDTLIAYKYKDNWLCFECAPCDYENLKHSVKSLRGTIFVFLYNIEK